MITQWWGHSCFRRWDHVVYVYIHIVVVVYIDVLCDALHWTAHERLNEEITLIYSAAVLNTNSKSTSVSLRTLVSEISSIVLTVSSLSICILNSNTLSVRDWKMKEIVFRSFIIVASCCWWLFSLCSMSDQLSQLHCSADGTLFISIKLLITLLIYKCSLQMIYVCCHQFVKLLLHDCFSSIDFNN